MEWKSAVGARNVGVMGRAAASGGNVGNVKTEGEEICLTKGYVCLKSTCEEAFLTWGEARQHMKKGCFQGKPNMGQSREKAENLQPLGKLI